MLRHPKSESPLPAKNVTSAGPASENGGGDVAAGKFNASPSEREAAAPTEVYFPESDVLFPESDVIFPDSSAAPSAEAGKQKPETEAAPGPGVLGRCWRLAGSAVEWLFGVASLLAGLAVLSSTPLLQFLSFGYLLEVSGRVIRSGRLSQGFVGIRKAGRVGALVLHTWIALLPLRLISDVWYDAYVIDPTSAVTAAWQRGLWIATVLIGGHILTAWYCGGRGRYFYWPLTWPWHLTLTLMRRRRWSEWFPPARLAAGWSSSGPSLWEEARDKVWDFVTGLRLPYYFSLGARGFVGALAWLTLPVLLLIGGSSLPAPASALSGLAGGLLMAAVALYLPFLEAQYAADGALASMFQVRRVRERFRRAPILFFLALLVTLAFALPLYLLEIQPLIREFRWLPGLVFAVLLLPARLLTGWAMSCADRRERPRMFLFTWSARLGALPAVVFYAFVVYLSQFVAWHGPLHMLEQPPFMLPSPFLFLGQ